MEILSYRQEEKSSLVEMYAVNVQTILKRSVYIFSDWPGSDSGSQPLTITSDFTI